MLKAFALMAWSGYAAAAAPGPTAERTKAFDEINALVRVERGDQDRHRIHFDSAKACIVTMSLTWPKWRAEDERYASAITRMTFDAKAVTFVFFEPAKGIQAERPENSASAYIGVAFIAPQRFQTSAVREDGSNVDEPGYTDGFEIPAASPGPSAAAQAILQGLSKIRDKCKAGPGKKNPVTRPVADTPEEQYRLGSAYMHARYAVPDAMLGREWYLKAAQGGHVYAQLELGNMYRSGLQGVRRDLKTARAWFEAAAEQDATPAFGMLGDMYEYGLGGVEVDLVKAAAYYRRAAERGDVISQESLADMLRFGRGMPKDTAEARMWYLKAAAGNSSTAREALRSMEAETGDEK